MPEAKFIDNQEADIETAILYPKKEETAEKPEVTHVVVTCNPPIWKRVLFIALIFLSGFATSVIFHRLHHHFHGRGHFGQHKHPHHHPHDGPHEPDEAMLGFEKGFPGDEIFEKNHPMHPPPMYDPMMGDERMRPFGKKHKHHGEWMPDHHKGRWEHKHPHAPPFFDSDSDSSSDSSDSSSSSDSMDDEEIKDIMDSEMEIFAEIMKEENSPGIDFEPEVEFEDIEPFESFKDGPDEVSLINISRQEESP
jgi:hypothetical protein